MPVPVERPGQAVHCTPAHWRRWGTGAHPSHAHQGSLSQPLLHNSGDDTKQCAHQYTVFNNEQVGQFLMMN